MKKSKINKNAKSIEKGSVVKDANAHTNKCILNTKKQISETTSRNIDREIRNNCQEQDESQLLEKMNLVRQSLLEIKDETLTNGESQHSKKVNHKPVSNRHTVVRINNEYQTLDYKPIILQDPLKSSGRISLDSLPKMSRSRRDSSQATLKRTSTCDSILNTSMKQDLVGHHLSIDSPRNPRRFTMCSTSRPLSNANKKKSTGIYGDVLGKKLHVDDQQSQSDHNISLS